MSKNPELLPGLKNGAILLGWAGGIILAGTLLWALTQPLRDRALMRSVNRIFAAANESRRLAEVLPRPRVSGRNMPMGSWFALADSQERLFVFPVIRDGVMVPCAALIGAGGRVEQIIPLGEHAEQIMKRMPRGILDIYVRRIEGPVSGEAEG
jgi:hypothetical protein